MFKTVREMAEETRKRNIESLRPFIKKIIDKKYKKEIYKKLIERVINDNV